MTQAIKYAKDIYDVSGMTEMFDQDLDDLFEYDEKNKRQGAKIMRTANNVFLYILGIIIVVQVIISSVAKYGTVKLSKPTSIR